jgi:putative tryptophan/tyrosine transport system substrate-binding protein
MIARRVLLRALGGGLLGAPLAARAQPAAKVHRIGILFGGTSLADMAGPEPRSSILRAFLQGLHELGYVEGKNVVIERRSAEGGRSACPPSSPNSYGSLST